MEEQKPTTGRQSFIQLLEKLQQDSWQLELLISGFALFLLIGAYEQLEYLSDATDYLEYSLEDDFLVRFPMLILFVGWFILIFNMFVHVLLRGLWISTIGLRYVSGEIDYDELKYSRRFTNYLKRRIGTFDRYIDSLENLCSVVFSFTFLLVFIFISFGLYILVFGLLVNSIKSIEAYLINPTVGKIIRQFLGISFLISGLIYFIDFLTLGFIKRLSWFSRIYLPIYRILSTITLSFLYRPMYYNLIDNKFGRRIGLMMIPYSIILVMSISLFYETHIYFPNEQNEHLIFFNDHYEDLRETKKLIKNPVIPSKYVQNHYLEFFIPYWPTQMDSVIARVCPDFVPLKKTALKTSAIEINFENTSTKAIKAKTDSTFQCLTHSYQVTVNDSLFDEVNYRLYTHPNQDEKGIKAILDLAYLDRGEHLLTIKRRAYKTRKNASDSLYWRNYTTIPFWKE